MPYKQLTEDELRQLAKEMILGLTESQCRELLTEKELAENVGCSSLSVLGMV